MLRQNAFAILLIVVTTVFSHAEGVLMAAAPSTQSQISKSDLAHCTEALRATVDALDTSCIEFTADITYAVPNLPRVTGEKGLLCLDDGRMFYRFERTFPPLPGRPHVVELEEIAYDGNTYYLGKRSKGASPSIKTMLGDNPDNPHGWQNFTKHCPYLDVAGLQFPRKVAQWKGGKVTSIVLDYLSQGQVTHAALDPEDENTLIIKVIIPDPIVFDAQKTDLDLLVAELRQRNAQSTEIEAAITAVEKQRASGRQRLVEMRLDSKKNYCLTRRIESTTDGKMIFDIEGREFKQTEKPNVWLPKDGTIKTFVRNILQVEGFSVMPEQTTLVRLQEIAFQSRKDISFALDYGAGTMIVDRSSKASQGSSSGELTYISPASLEDLRKVTEGNGGRQWLLIANIGLVLFLVCMIIRGKLSRRAD